MFPGSSSRGTRPAMASRTSSLLSWSHSKLDSVSELNKRHTGKGYVRGCQDARKMMKVLQDAVMVRQKIRKVVVEYGHVVSLSHLTERTRRAREEPLAASAHHCAFRPTQPNSAHPNSYRKRGIREPQVAFEFHHRKTFTTGFMNDGR